jgi:hypothetical protein
VVRAGRLLKSHVRGLAFQFPKGANHNFTVNIFCSDPLTRYTLACYISAVDDCHVMAESLRKPADFEGDRQFGQSGSVRHIGHRITDADDSGDNTGRLTRDTF